MKNYSKKSSTFYQLKGYAGLTHMAKHIVKYYPKNINIYVEPFAGLGRTRGLINPTVSYLNDLSCYSITFLKEKFPHDYIYMLDFRLFIPQFKHNKEVFMFIDFPWRKNIYQNNTKPVCTNTPIEYTEIMFSYLRNCDHDWMMAIDKDEHEIGKRFSKSEFPNLVLEHETVKLFNRPIGVRLISNKEFKIQE